MTNLILHILGNTLALYMSAYLIKGVEFHTSPFPFSLIDYFIAGLLLGILNFLVKPILKIISAPLIILTLGLFIFIINLFILWLLQALLPGTLSIQGFGAYFWTLVIITIINFLINHFQED